MFYTIYYIATWHVISTSPYYFFQFFHHLSCSFLYILQSWHWIFQVPIAIVTLSHVDSNLIYYSCWNYDFSLKSRQCQWWNIVVVSQCQRQYCRVGTWTLKAEKQWKVFCKGIWEFRVFNRCRKCGPLMLIWLR